MTATGGLVDEELEHKIRSAIQRWGNDKQIDAFEHVSSFNRRLMSTASSTDNLYALTNPRAMRRQKRKASGSMNVPREILNDENHLPPITVHLVKHESEAITSNGDVMTEQGKHLKTIRQDSGVKVDDEEGNVMLAMDENETRSRTASSVLSEQFSPESVQKLAKAKVDLQKEVTRSHKECVILLKWC